MFGNMRQLPDEIAQQWDQGQPDEHPYQKHMRDVRLAKEAKQRFIQLCIAGVSLLVGFVVGHFTPLLVAAVLTALLTITLTVQAVVWVRRELRSRDVARKIDEGIKVIEPKAIDKQEDNAVGKERAA